MSSHRDPTRIERVGDSGLKVVWSDGHESLYSWVLLRTSCPCAACRRPGFSGLVMAPADIRPLEIKPVGRYAMAVRWSDGHTTGIFSYEHLRSLCPCEACHPTQLDEG